MPEALLASPVWKEALRRAADPERVRTGLKQLAAPAGDKLRRFNADRAQILAAVLSGSHALTTLLVKHSDWLGSLEPELLRNPRREQGLRREVAAWLQPALQTRNYSDALRQLRVFQQRELLRIAARDLARFTNAVEATLELSNVADVCLSAVLEICAPQLVERFGHPYHKDPRDEWVPTQLAIIGLGKLGGRDLNYSSDVDIIFLYSEEGNVFKEPPRRGTDPGRALTNHQYFKRLVEAVVAELTRSTPEGTLYRVDLRLRPEGDAGPLARSLPSYETFYSQWGQTWERMMLMKARDVAGDGALANEFLEMIQPFRFPRSLPNGALREVADMKRRMEEEVVKAGELDRNVKLGRGGIREIEFIVQSTQLVHAGRIPFLQGPQTLPTLEKMVQYKLIEAADAQRLRDAYFFLRDVEHRLQMDNHLQTHTIPRGPHAREHLGRLMGFATAQKFDAACRAHMQNVRKLYSEFLPADEPKADSSLPRHFVDHDEAWKKILSEHGFKRTDDSLRFLKEFVHGPGYGHVSKRTEDLAWQLIPGLLQLCPSEDRIKRLSPHYELKEQRPSSAPLEGKPRKAHRTSSQDIHQKQALSDPDRVLARLDSFISAYGGRAVMFETWTGNPLLFELLLLLFDRSEFLAERAIHTPDLVDELVLSGRFARSKSATETLEELRHGSGDSDQGLWIRRYHQAEFMRIGLRDILGLADPEQNLVELSALADACLQYALEVVTRKHKASAIAIIGLGKLGGQELTYGSDLDIVFVAADKVKNLPKMQRLAIDLMDLLSSPSQLGIAFVTDARLRPDGAKGLLVNTLSAYEDYYRSRAQLWEIQALARARPVAGDPKIGEQFRTMARALTNFSRENVANGFSIASRSSPKPRASRSKNATRTGLSAYTPNWKQEIARMRLRIEKERTPAGQADVAIKTGAGGLIDAEFIAQALCLEHGWLEPNTLRALEKARDEKAHPLRDATKLIENFRQLRRIESILRRWSFEGEAELPVDPAPYYRVSIRCGFRSPQEFRKAVAGYRKAIRTVYQKVFPGS